MANRSAQWSATALPAEWPPLSLYLHFPWCVAKCPYCDFNSYRLNGDLPAADYVAALLDDLRQQPAELKQRPLVSVFMGGGTPSLFSPDELQRVLDAVRAQFVLADDCEITLEANPGVLEHAAFSGYRDAGINRLSLGAQSFSDAMLQRLGRVHNREETGTAFAEARAAGFDNINLDLMYALPGQTLACAGEDVARAIELQPEHISYYHLTLEPNTVFFARPPARLPDDDLAWEIQAAGAARLHAAGYENYEVSAWGQPGKHSRHNLNYWRFGDYLGVGAGAHGKLSGAAGIHREQRPAHPRAYVQAIADREAGNGKLPARSVVSPADAVFEFMLNGMRLRDGIAIQDFEKYTGLSAGLLEPGLHQAGEQGLVEQTAAGRICPSARGWRFLDDLQAIFLPAAQTSGS